MGDQRPNILLITTDQHRGDHLGLAGHPVLETPNIDALAADGAYFPNAYTEIPSTTGARRVMLSGQASFVCGFVGYAAVEWDERDSLADCLARAGYHCINVGWRNLHPGRKLYGFHTVIPHEMNAEADEYGEWLRQQIGPEAHERAHGLDPNGWEGRVWHLDEHFHPTVWTTDVALEQLEKRDPTRPFFMWLSYRRPHSPYDPPRFYWDMYIDRKLPEVPVGDWASRFDVPQPGLSRTAWFGRLTEAQLQRTRAAYMGLCTQIDHQIGRVIEWLMRNRLFGNTLIIFCSDHGDMQGDHCLLRKTYAYEGSARIPFVIKYPASLDLPAGTFEHVVGLQDVMPTILDVAGVPAPEGLTGRSVLEAIRGGQWREFIHGEHSPCYSREMGVQYVTDGREKFVWYPMTGEEQFFDLTADRHERENLAGQPEYADRVELWRRRLIEALRDRPEGFTDGRRLLRLDKPWGPLAEGWPR